MKHMQKNKEYYSAHHENREITLQYAKYHSNHYSTEEISTTGTPNFSSSYIVRLRFHNRMYWGRRRNKSSSRSRGAGFRRTIKMDWPRRDSQPLAFVKFKRLDQRAVRHRFCRQCWWGGGEIWTRRAT